MGETEASSAGTKSELEQRAWQAGYDHATETCLLLLMSALEGFSAGLKGEPAEGAAARALEIVERIRKEARRDRPARWLTAIGASLGSLCADQEKIRDAKDARPSPPSSS